jgi:hypothetical protein
MHPRAQISVFGDKMQSSYSKGMYLNVPPAAPEVCLVSSRVLDTPKSKILICFYSLSLNIILDGFKS